MALIFQRTLSINFSLTFPPWTEPHAHRCFLNGCTIPEFLFLAFTDTQNLQLLHFLLFLGIYLTTLLANGLIITAVACNHHFHTPMYFFLLTSPSLTWASSPLLSPNPWPKMGALGNAVCRAQGGKSPFRTIDLTDFPLFHCRLPCRRAQLSPSISVLPRSPSVLKSLKCCRKAVCKQL